MFIGCIKNVPVSFTPFHFQKWFLVFLIPNSVLSLDQRNMSDQKSISDKIQLRYTHFFNYQLFIAFHFTIDSFFKKKIIDSFFILLFTYAIFSHFWEKSFSMSWWDWLTWSYIFLFSQPVFFFTPTSVFCNQYLERFLFIIVGIFEPIKRYPANVYLTKVNNRNTTDVVLLFL